MKSLPIPQREFAFVADTFGLIQDSAPDGDRLAREREGIGSGPPCQRSGTAQTASKAHREEAFREIHLP